MIGMAGQVLGIAAQAQAQQKQYKNQQELMKQQFNNNQAMANANQQRAKDLWDYTNYENQVKHMKNAGLSIGLMYGQAGAGGGSAQGAGTGQGSSLPQDQSVMAGLRAKEIGLQIAATQSQIKLNESAAEKNKAEAEKTRGADTELAGSMKELNNAIAAIQPLLGNLYKANEQVSAAEYFKIQKEQDKVWQEARKMATEADVAETTKEAKITEISYNSFNTMLEGIEKIAGIRLTDRQIARIGQEMEGYWYELETKRISANAAEKAAQAKTDEVINNLGIKTRYLDQNDTRLLQDWIFRGIHGAAEISEQGLGWATKGLSKGIRKVITESWDGKGRSKGWTETTERRE